MAKKKVSKNAKKSSNSKKSTKVQGRKQSRAARNSESGKKSKLGKKSESAKLSKKRKKQPELPKKSKTRGFKKTDGVNRRTYYEERYSGYVRTERFFIKSNAFQFLEVDTQEFEDAFLKYARLAFTKAKISTRSLIGISLLVQSTGQSESGEEFDSSHGERVDISFPKNISKQTYLNERKNFLIEYVLGVFQSHATKDPRYILDVSEKSGDVTVYKCTEFTVYAEYETTKTAFSKASKKDKKKVS